MFKEINNRFELRLWNVIVGIQAFYLIDEAEHVGQFTSSLFPALGIRRKWRYFTNGQLWRAEQKQHCNQVIQSLMFCYIAVLKFLNRTTLTPNTSTLKMTSSRCLSFKSGRQHFRGFCGKGFPADSRYSNGNKLGPLLADIFLYSYEAEFIQSLLSTERKQLASQFNFIYRYIDDVLSIKFPEFENYLGQMYPVELEIKDTTESNTFASYLDLLLSIGRDGQLHTSIYDKRDDFNFHILNFPFLSSNIPTSPAYGVFISQPIRYVRACSSYGCFILRATRLSNKLLEQGYVKERLKSPLRKF